MNSMFQETSYCDGMDQAEEGFQKSVGQGLWKTDKRAIRQISIQMSKSKWFLETTMIVWKKTIRQIPA